MAGQPDLDAGAGLTTGEVIVYPGKGHAPHLHPDDQEVIYVISGEGVQTVDEDTPAFPIKAGDAVYIPANTLHSTFNTTWQPLRLVVIYTPVGPRSRSTTCPTSASSTPASRPNGGRTADGQAWAMGPLWGMSLGVLSEPS